MAASAGGGSAMLRWQLLPGQLLTQRGWHDEYVLFNSLSGDTHLLGADAIAVFLDLRDSPIVDIELDDDDAGTRALLDRLVALGLIAVTPC